MIAGNSFPNYIWKLIALRNWGRTHLWFSLITFHGRCQSIKVTKGVQFSPSSFAGNQRWSYWAEESHLPWEEGITGAIPRPFILEYGTAWAMSVVPFVWWGFFWCLLYFFYRFFLMFICFSWHLKGTWLLGVIIILHMLYGVCLLPDNWGTDVCSLEAGGEEREGWEVQGMDDGAAEAGAAEQCWVLQGGFPFITTSHTSLGSNSN